MAKAAAAVATSSTARARIPSARRWPWGVCGEVKPVVQPGQQGAGPGDRVADRAVDEGGIADCRLQDQGGQRQFDVGKMVHGFAEGKRRRYGIMAATWMLPAGFFLTRQSHGSICRPASIRLRIRWWDSAEAWTRLPDPSLLEDAARAAYGGGSSVGVVAAAGAQALIQWLPRVFPARRVGMLGFTYKEHEACWRASGAEVVTVAALVDLVGFDVGVVVNPNNPDGRLCVPSEMADVAGALARAGGRLIVDEAFMDLLGPGAQSDSLFADGDHGAALIWQGLWTGGRAAWVCRGITRGLRTIARGAGAVGGIRGGHRNRPARACRYGLVGAVRDATARGVGSVGSIASIRRV